LVLQHRRELLGQEGLPLVVLAVLRLVPVGVEARLAADRQHDVDVLVGEEPLDVGLDGPARGGVASAQPVEHEHLWGARARGVAPVWLCQSRATRICTWISSSIAGE